MTVNVRSQFQYTVHPTNRTVIIVDAYNTRSQLTTDRYPLTVTNDIENVIAYICDHDSFTPESRVWIYMDSVGEWSGYDPVAKEFYYIGLREPTIVELILNSPEVQSRLKQLPNEL